MQIADALHWYVKDDDTVWVTVAMMMSVSYILLYTIIFFVYYYQLMVWYGWVKINSSLLTVFVVCSIYMFELVVAHTWVALLLWVVALVGIVCFRLPATTWISPCSSSSNHLMLCFMTKNEQIVDFCCGANDFSLFMKEKLEKRGRKCNYKNYDLFRPKV